MGVYMDELKFTHEAIGYFEQHPEKVSYTNADEDLIALRWGMDNDCVKVLKIEREVIFVNNCMTPVKLKTTVDKGPEPHDAIYQKGDK